MPARSTRVDVIGATAAGLSVVLLCLVLLWRNPLLFWNDDYQLSILPVFADVARSWNEGNWPILCPYSWVCGNLAGEFQYGTFSIFVNAAVVLIWKLIGNFSHQAAALSISHLAVLAMGGFVLARERKFSVPLSTMVAFVAALNGWIMCWGATDWFGALGAFAWLPWAWWGLERAADGRRGRWRFLWPAPFVYLVVAGGFPYTVVMLALLIAWISMRSLVQTRSLGMIGPIVLGVALGLGLSAPAWLAIFDYVHGSARQAQSASAHWQWIVPPSALPAMILPCWTVNWADFSTRYVPHSGTELCAGLVAPVAVLSGLMLNGRVFIRNMRWEFGLLLLVLAIAMLPSAGVFRWSFRWLPFFHLILALCAVEGIRGLDLQKISAGRLRLPLYLLVALFLTGVSAVVMSILKTTGDHAFPLTWILLGLIAVWALVESVFYNSELRRWSPALITLSAFLATYLCIPPNCGVPRYNLSADLLQAAPLDPDRLYLSIYPPAEHTYRVEAKSGPVGQIVRPGSTSMWAGLRFVNGYSPILASGVGREFGFAIHGEIDGNMGRYLLAEQAGADGELARLGVDGITIASEMDFDPAPASEWELVTSTAEGRVFHRRGAAYPRIRALTSSQERMKVALSPVIISRIKEARNRAEADVEVPNGAVSANIGFSRPYFRGYEARLGDQKLMVRSERGLFPVVELPSGSKGHLTLSYRPWWLVYGSALAILCAGIFVAGVAAAAVTGGRT
ncbi:MAG: hypothetical protein QOH39_1307 [Verrucomicrobiota bacterium]